MFGMTNVDYQAAMFRHAEIKREAECLGPMYWELRERRREAGIGSGFGRVRSAFAASVAGARTFFGSLRVRRLADGSSI
jgi:hypothetical protein